MTDQSSTDAGGSRSAPSRKGQLFCPACRYSAPVDGDWRAEDAAAARSLRCPACDALVVRQPATRLLVPP